jgi:hypothetical protein
MKTLFGVLCAVLILTKVSAATERVDYLTDIKPLLTEKCYFCHGRLKQEADLRLETRSLMIDGGVVVPGKPLESELLHRVTAAGDERMPPEAEGSALKDDEIQLLRSWIAQGAVAPEEEIPSAPQQHWAFQQFKRPEITDSDKTNPIDALLSAKRAARSLTPQPPAERSILIRRLYLDLIGLPPTRQQLQDQRPWENIVDDLLASPHHGERWGRHWMDVWRYSDWYGLGAQLRNSQKHLWHWRDWIIDSLNADKPYDRMIQEMLAGDELAPQDIDAIRATGFLARNYYLFNRTTWLDSTIEHTGKAFLGLTLNCAKCHDHKYDPVTQLDYYRMRAIFEPHQVRLDPVPGETDFEKDGLPRVFDDHPDLETYLHRRGDPKNPDKETKITAGVPDFLASFQPEIKPVDLPYQAYAPGARDYVQQDYLQAAKTAVEQAEQQLTAARGKLAETPPEEPQEKAREQAAFEVTDDFSKPNPEVWKLIGDGWQYRDGSLHQTKSTREGQLVRLVQQPPPDFELSCKYTTTGGSTYKSVTFRFDQSDDGKYANFVYTSAHAPGPKLHVAFTRAGNTAYPDEGRKNRPIKVGQTYTLRFAVRDNLVNAWIDDEFMLAYRLPDRRPDGFLSLSGFDATVAFDEISIRSLPADIELTEAKNSVAASVSDLAAAVKAAEANVVAAAARVAATQAVFAADNARYRDDADAETIEQLSKTASRLQAEQQAATARYQMLVDAADKNKRSAAEKRLKQAEEKLAAIEQGEFQYESIRAAKKALETPAHKETDYPVVYAPVSTGRRLALARWITSPQNPLTARVAVNHVWMRHFGQPLVESVFDFGLRSPRPANADVLDLLAYEFVQSGWSFRHLHRLICNSETYRLSSSSAGADETTLAADPANQFYWRMNGRRMESQIVRDSLLQLAGDLDTKRGGPSVAANSDSRRRSLYFKHSRDDQDKFLKMFDDADLLQCYRRSESIVPQQALALSNSGLSIKMATKIAEQIAADTGPDQGRDAFIAAVFETLLARPATDQEVLQCTQFFGELAQLFAGKSAESIEPRLRARFVHAMLNHNDFITIR